MQTADKFNRYRMRISRPPWARDIFVPDSRAASLLISSQLYELPPSQPRDFLSRTSFHARLDSLHSIEHPVYDDSGHGNIEPDGKGPTSDAPVPIEAFFKGPKERDQSERDNRRCQNGVSEKNGEIDQPYAALPFEWNGTDLVMVNEIRSQKKYGTGESREHARFVRLDVSRFNEKVSANQENGAE
jgi:hypothetical protein